MHPPFLEILYVRYDSLKFRNASEVNEARR